MPPLKKVNAAKNVIIRYREMNGIKLTVLLPTLHNQIKASIMAQAADPNSPPVASLVLCHSQLRAAQFYDFATELTVFCTEIVEVVNIDAGHDDAIAKLQRVASASKASAEGSPMVFKKSVVLIGTPGNFAALLRAKAFTSVGVSYHSVILDKVDLLQAMDFKDEIIEVAAIVKEAQVNGKLIFTTNVRDETDLSVDEQEDFQAIKSALMGNEKALIVRMNDDE